MVIGRPWQVIKWRPVNVSTDGLDTVIVVNNSGFYDGGWHLYIQSGTRSRERTSHDLTTRGGDGETIG